MSLKSINPNAELMNADAALFMNINAAKGLQDVMKTNLGPKGTIKMLVDGAGGADGTGLIEVKEWMNDDCAGLAEMRQETMKENVYICVVGQVKEYDSKKSIVGNNVRVIESSNELTHHMLEAVYSAEKYKRGTQIVGADRKSVV